MKDYAKIVGQPPVPNRPEVRVQSGGNPRRPVSQQQRAGQQRVPPQKKEGAKIGIWIFVVLIALVVLFSAYRQHLHRQASALGNHTDKSTVSAQAAAPQYDFYSVLPSGNNPAAAATASSSTSATSAAATAVSATATTTTPVAATPAAGSATTTAATPGATTTSVANAPAVTQAPAATPPAATPAGPVKYYLNAGSYANSADANQMLSQLLLAGVDAAVVTTQDNGAPAYQVLVGPFASVAAYSPVKQQLAAHQVQVSVVQQ